MSDKCDPWNHSVNNHSDTIRFILYIDFKTNNVYGTRIKGNGSATKLDYPTVNLILNSCANSHQLCVTPAPKLRYV